RGNIYIYGEHFKTPEEGNALAGIRAEELLCREAHFFGEGTVPSFLTGYIFEMHDHYRDSYNQRYLITELSHQGTQSTYLTGAGGATSETENQGPAYFNNFSCIPAGVQFRPERLAEKTRLDGTLNATVDASGDGQYAEIDDQGRYKVKLPFDQGDAADGKASRWVRMTQPYAGADYGMHFPLHKGTEVLLTFVDGDPDRPIIAGTVPNPETGSPVTGANQSQSMIRTAGGNQIRIEDNDGGQQIHMSSPTSNSIISLGDVNEGNIFLKSDGTWVSKIGDNAIEKIGADKRTYVKGTEVKDITVNQGIHIGGSQTLVVNTNRDVTVYGKENKEVKGNSWHKVNGPKSSMTVGATHEVCIAAKATQNLAAVSDITVGVKQGAFAGANIETNAAAKLEFNATVKYEKSVSKSNKAVKIEQDAKTLIKLDCSGALVTIEPGGIKIKASKVRIAAPKISLTGEVFVKKKLTVAKDIETKHT
ncbi:type VI secretion system tip protein VgrG, partial [Desulfobulbus sp. US1]|nr:type VI secretion system tip protein VgrG [Desulfobulbus sp. US1]